MLKHIAFLLFAFLSVGIVTAQSPVEGIVSTAGPFELSVSDVSITEGSSVVDVMVSLNIASIQDTSFTYTTVDDSAVAGADYVAKTGSATIPNGSFSTIVSIFIIDDSLDELAETFQLELSDPTNAAVIADGTGVVTIEDDDSPPQLSVGSVSVNEGAGSVDVTVSLDAPSGLPVGFDYATADISAIGSSDYGTASGSQTILAGQTTATITIAIVDDDIFEGTETFSLNVANVQNATVLDNSGEITIIDNDGAPTLSVDSVSVNEDAGTVDVIVSLSTSSSLDVTFDYATDDSSAQESSDYVATTGNRAMSAGQISTTLTIPIIDDLIDEGDETFFVRISNPVHTTIADDTATVTIIDNDAAPTLSVSDMSVNEEDGSVSVVVSLNVTSSLDVSFDYATVADGTATAGIDFTMTSGSGTIVAGRQSTTITVNIVSDSVDEADETFSLLIGNPVHATISDSVGIITIIDDDSTALTLSVGDLFVSEGDGSVSVIVNLSAVSSLDVSFDYATVSGTATAGDDFTATSGNTTIPAGQQSATITIDILSDSIDEPDETFSLQIDEPSNAIIGDGISILTILDDDALPTLSVSDETVSEDAGTVEVTISLNTESGRDVSFDYETVDNSATAGEDYTSNTGSATISAGDTSTTVSIAILNDDLGELEESFHLEISNPTLATIDNDTGVIAITPDSDRFKLYLPISAKQYHPFVNGGFETGGFGSGWSASGAMGAQVVSVIDIDGNLGQATDNGWIDGDFAALLGNPSYNNTGGVPVGFGEIRQTITLQPNASDIRLKYRIVTHDQVFASSSGRYYDSFEVSINTVEPSNQATPRRNDLCRTNHGVPATDATGLVLCDGFTSTPARDNPPNNIQRTKTIDISNKSGQNITLILRIYNRVDSSYNTWVYVDSVEVLTER